MGKHLIPDFLQYPLGYDDHKTCIEKRSRRTGIVDTGHHRQRTQKRRKTRIALSEKRQDIVVNQTLKKQVPKHAGQRADRNTHCHDDTVNLIILPYICQQTAQCLPGIFASPSAAHPAHSGAFHSSWTTHLYPLLSAAVHRCPDKFHCSQEASHGYQILRSFLDPAQ